MIGRQHQLVARICSGADPSVRVGLEPRAHTPSSVKASATPGLIRGSFIQVVSLDVAGTRNRASFGRPCQLRVWLDLGVDGASACVASFQRCSSGVLFSGERDTVL